MHIEIYDGWNEEAVNVVVKAGNTLFQTHGCFRDRLPDELREFADGLMVGEPFAPELGYEPAFNVAFVADTYFLWRYRRKFRNRWLWWAGLSKVRSKSEKIAASVAYLRAFANRLDGS